MNKGLSREQTHRILEDLQRISIIDGILEFYFMQQKGELAKRLIYLLKEEHQALGRDVQGMLNGNSGNADNRRK